LPVWLDEWQHPETYSNQSLLKNIAIEVVRLPDQEDASAIPSFRHGSPESRLQGCPKVCTVHGA